MIEFEIEGRAISLNQIYAKHWSRRQENKILWGWQIKSALLKYKIPKIPIQYPVEIQFIYYVNRPIDVDNCAGTCKVIIDFLREWGLLKQDSPAWVKKITIQVITNSNREYVKVAVIK